MASPAAAALRAVAADRLRELNPVLRAQRVLADRAVQAVPDVEALDGDSS